MKLPSETSFATLIKFMYEQKLLSTKNAVVRPLQKETQIIGHHRKIQECYNIIKLSFIVEEMEDKGQAAKIQALRNE